MPYPLQCYRDDLAKGIIKPDAAQALAVNELQRLFDELLQAKAPEKKMNARSAQFFLLGLMRRLPEDVASMRQQLQENPVRSAASIREVMAKLIASPA